MGGNQRNGGNGRILRSFGQESTSEEQAMYPGLLAMLMNGSRANSCIKNEQSN